MLARVILPLLGCCKDDFCCFQAWQEDPADALKLMALLRDVRDGKGEQKLFHECAIWLLKHHPLTLISNLSEIVKVMHGTPFLLPMASPFVGEHGLLGVSRLDVFPE